MKAAAAAGTASKDRCPASREPIPDRRKRVFPSGVAGTVAAGGSASGTTRVLARAWTVDRCALQSMGRGCLVVTDETIGPGGVLGAEPLEGGAKRPSTRWQEPT